MVFFEQDFFAEQQQLVAVFQQQAFRHFRLMLADLLQQPIPLVFDQGFDCRIGKLFRHHQGDAVGSTFRAIEPRRWF